MNTNETDRLFREMARAWVEQEGTQLHEELRQMTQDGVHYMTPGLDKRVRAQTIGRGHRRFGRYMGVLAACILLVLMVPTIVNYIGMDMNQSDSTSTEEPASGGTHTEAEDTAPAETAAPEQERDQAMAEGSASEAATPSPEYKLLPLSAALPGNLSIERVEQDNEKSIYYLADQLQDDVVVTLEPDTWEYQDYQEMIAIPLGGTTVYAASEESYNLMTFEKEDIRYVMTCQYDINTLVELTEYIL